MSNDTMPADPAQILRDWRNNNLMIATALSGIAEYDESEMPREEVAKMLTDIAEALEEGAASQAQSIARINTAVAAGNFVGIPAKSDVARKVGYLVDEFGAEVSVKIERDEDGNAATKAEIYFWLNRQMHVGYAAGADVDAALEVALGSIDGVSFGLN